MNIKEIVYVGISLAMLVIIPACGTMQQKHEFGDEYGWTCVSEQEAEGQDTKVVGPDKFCVLVKTDRDDTKDFFIREYEYKKLPSMPDLP